MKKIHLKYKTYASLIKQVSVEGIEEGHLSGLVIVGCVEDTRNLGIIDEIFDQEVSGGPRLSHVAKNSPELDLLVPNSRLNEHDDYGVCPK
jgi:hypothetical protein